MAEGQTSRRLSQGYAHACERAELLGVTAPTEDEWLSSDERAREIEELEREEHDDAVAKELDGTEESSKRIGGGLDELNTILNATQKKINKFKNVCGSLGTLLKARVASSSNSNAQPEGEPQAGPSVKDQLCSDDAGAAAAAGSLDNEQGSIAELANNEADSQQQDDRQRANAVKRTDINAKMGSHLGKLESLINKAENAQYSMKHQNKQMKNFLK